MKRRDRKRTKREGKTLHAMQHGVAAENRTSGEQSTPGSDQEQVTSDQGGVDRRKAADQR
jgi:hypothetical protein